ncbi:hypothetical protein [Bradyrhizobium sp. ORS 375]|uniref:hypothetical protein n=1 Tax=Bradyrhizobium sp. (strain ORS 375) TaxID=566679 RepID=UPI001112680F|nr:hypothetical protein [Bradyrhizobium sp. ORS 375]
MQLTWRKDARRSGSTHRQLAAQERQSLINGKYSVIFIAVARHLGSWSDVGRDLGEAQGQGAAFLDHDWRVEDVVPAVSDSLVVGR